MTAGPDSGPGAASGSSSDAPSASNSLARVREFVRLDERTQRRLARLMQLALIGLLFIGFERGNLGIIVNAGVALAITYLPATLERDHYIPMNAGLTLWITSAVFLHALGTVGVPGTDESFYTSLAWWDSLTHALSASVVAAIGYTVARAIDEHTEAVELPGRFMFVFILLFVVAFGVFWEVLEFAVGGAAELLGNDAILTQYGLEDTMTDLLFDLVGGVVVAIWGTAHLTDVAGALAARLDRS
ncbi:hypothetical protein HSB1_25360 [Halogranum salarium B-1]|uniref:Membrane-spanning protein n=2 Tax=Halogranum rubrum TaxID=553466 RepID=J2ZEL5_9EURY|nr:hypothetical protein HSB1_25360 [Halogranum salarium B-1]